MKIASRQISASLKKKNLKSGDTGPLTFWLIKFAIRIEGRKYDFRKKIAQTTDVETHC